MTATARPRHTLNDLVTVLDRLSGLHDDLCAALVRKLDCIRRADYSAMHACDHTLRTLTGRIGEQNGLRKQLAEQLGKPFGLAPERARDLTLNEFAGRLADPDRTRVMASADRLRAVVRDVEALNRLIDRVAAEVLNHVHQAVAAITTQPDDGVQYTRDGRPRAAARRELFEALG